MPTNTVRSSYDTFTWEAFPNNNHGDWRKFNLDGTAGARMYCYAYFAGMPPSGATVISATLRVWVKNGFDGGPHTVTVKRINAAWKESKLTWNRSGPGQMADPDNAASTQVTDGVDGQQVEFDVSALIADVAAGQPWYGLRLEVDTAGTKRLHSSEADPPDIRPQLVVEWSRAPLAPVDVAPSGGRSVSLSHPTLTWVFKDREGDEQAEFNVQIATGSTTNPDGSFSTPEFDTGFVVSGDEQFDTSTGVSRTASVSITSASTTITAATATFENADIGAAVTGTGIPAGTTITAVASPTSATISNAATASGTITATITRTYAGVADGAVRFWIVRTKDVNGLISPWSDVAEFRRDTKGTLTIDSPLDGGTVEETTPPITTTLTGRDQESVTYYLFELDGAGTTLVWSSGRFEAPTPAGIPFSFAVPAGRITRTGRQYRVWVYSTDTVDREGTPGDRTYLFANSIFTFVRSAIASPVTSLTAAEETPGVRLTFNRAAGVSAPDFFALMVDGVRVLDRIDPAEFDLGGDPIVYEFVWYGATPKTQHTFEVEAVVNDAGVLKHSQGNATQTFTFEVGGIWLVDDDEPPHLPSALPRKVRIRGAEEPDLQIGESSATFFPIGRRDPVQVVDAIRGLEGSVSGILDAADPFGQDFIENFKWMKTPERVGRRFRLLFGSENIPVQLGQADLTYTHSPPERRYAVSVEVTQVAEFLE